MELLNTVNQWIDKTRERIATEVQIPLIDDFQIDMTSELVDAWMWQDTQLREVLENVLSRDPEDIAIRHVTLSTYYQLVTLAVPEKEEEEVTHKRKNFLRQLAYFVHLRDIDHCRTPRDIRWEITNACSINDHPRALGLCTQLQSLVSEFEYHYLSGRLNFLIGHSTTWEIEKGLAHWDLPIGPKPDGLRGFWQGVNVLSLCLAGLNKVMIGATTAQDQRDHLRDAIKHLEHVRSQKEPSDTPFMLARCYADIGDYHNAAKTYQWMIDHHRELIASCAIEVGPAWKAETTGNILPDIYDCLVNAHERDGAIEKAITVTRALIKAFPEKLGTYERLARLHQANGDYHAAYDWLRREADRNPTLSEDPNVSIALALGSITTTPKIDETIATIASTHRDEQRRIGDVLSDYWPAYQRLSSESQERWATGTWLQSTSIPHASGLAAHCFAWVVERELRTIVIDAFGATLTPGTLKTNDGEAQYLERYLHGYGGLSLGQMLTKIERSMRSRNPLLASFGQWLRREHPWLGTNLQRLRPDKMVALRNREDHADIQTVNSTELGVMARTCRELLNLLHTALAR